jgi:hypothetical protein
MSVQAHEYEGFGDLPFSLTMIGQPSVDPELYRKLRRTKAVLGVVMAILVMGVCVSLIGMVLMEGPFFEWLLTGLLVGLIGTGRLGARYAQEGPTERWPAIAVGKSD